VNVALELVRFAELRPAQVRADRVALRCPFHEDRRPSAAVLASGVLVCSAGCGARSPFDWLVELGRSPAETMALLDGLELRDGDRRGRRRAGASRAPVRSREPDVDRPTSAAPARSCEPARELPSPLLDELAAAVVERRRYDGRLAELRGFSTAALELAGVGIGRPAAFGFAGPRGALEELRLLLPVRDERRRPVGLLAIAPNPERRHEPKVLARLGSPRLPLELAGVDEPLATMLLVTEGELDAIAAASAGIPAVGVPGVAGYGRHASRIAALVCELELERAVLVPDADAAGRRAFRELADAIDAAGVPSVLADVLDDGVDVGAALLELAGALELERPELSLDDRRRRAGRRLLSLTELAASPHEPSPRRPSPPSGGP
jgi:hypothetical protein